MEADKDLNYTRIAQAIDYIKENFRDQPNLDEIAEKVHLSPSHFQRLFTAWAGVSPKQFLQFISVTHAKQLLKTNQTSIFNTAHNTGLSGAGRLHDLFVKIEGMTPGDYKSGGKDLRISYSFAESPFGQVIAASTPKGICHLAFSDDRALAVRTLKDRFPQASFENNIVNQHKQALMIFNKDWSQLEEIKLHLKGTDFQINVWNTLLSIPSGQLTSYGNIAKHIDKPKASRAVGTAVGDNPVAFIIPCHRVIQATGVIGQYHWGSTRKNSIIGWESALNHLLKLKD